MNKVADNAHAAIADLEAGYTIAVGGFGLCGVPNTLIDAVLARGTDNLEIVSNNCGVEGWGLSKLLEARRVRRLVVSYIGGNRELARQYLAGELEVELTPQGTLAEKMRAGGSGVPAFYTATGAGTQVADGGLPWKFDADGSVRRSSPPKESRDFPTPLGPKSFLLESAILADFALVHAWKGDRHGNLVYRESARNFNPMAAMCGQITVAEVEVLVEPGQLDPDHVHTPGVFVDRVVELTPDQRADKPIERRTVRTLDQDPR